MQFSEDWSEKIGKLVVFPRKELFPAKWLRYTEYFHTQDGCICYEGLRPKDGQLHYDPVSHIWYYGVCSKHYPEGFAKSGPVPCLINLEDGDIIPWLSQDYNSPMMRYLYNLEYYIRREFCNLLHNIIVIYKFNKYSTALGYKSVELLVKIVGMINKKVVGDTVINLGDVSEPSNEFTEDTKDLWRNQIFFMIRTMLKREYFDRLLELSEILDQTVCYEDR